MTILPNFLRSLLLTIVVSFVTPLLLFGGVWVSFSPISYLLGLEAFQVIADQILQFLATFGNGNPWRGLVVIGLTFSVVGGLFDMNAFYRYRSWRGH